VKRIVLLLLVLTLLFTGCGAKGSIIGSWETESAAEMGLDISGGFIDTITRLTFLEEGIGAWEIEMVESREILRREFTYILEGDTLTILYPDATAQEFHVDFEKGVLLLTGRENLALKPVN